MNVTKRVIKENAYTLEMNAEEAAILAELLENISGNSNLVVRNFTDDVCRELVELGVPVENGTYWKPDSCCAAVDLLS